MGGETPASEATVAASLPPADLLEDSVGVMEDHAAYDRTRSPPADDEGDNRPGEDDHPNDDGRDHAWVDEPRDLADLRQKIIRQVEYYFSDENLPSDSHLLGLIKKNKGGFVPIRTIASFRKMKKLTDDQEFIATALKESSFLTVSTDGKKVKRIHPLPCDVRDEKLFTVLVENLPEDHSMPNLERMFSEVGKIKKICIHDPNSAEMSKKAGKIDKFLINKLHALVEYETVEAAEKAVATLHNEEDWRNGMRVKLLKRMVKQGQKKAWKAPDSQKNGAGHPSDLATDDQFHDSSQHDDHVVVEDDVDHIPKEKNEEGGRNHVRPRRHKHRGGMNGCGHGTTPSSHNVEVSKPPPGPRMPDGTRGFTMGRGRPPVLDHS